MHHNPGVVRSCHPVDPAMAVARPPQALAATPVEIDLNHQGACYALDCWLRTQEVNGEPGGGSPEFFEYLEQIGIDFPESVVPPQQSGNIKSHVKGSERDHRGHQNAAHATQEPIVPGHFSFAQLERNAQRHKTSRCGTTGFASVVSRSHAS